MISERFYRNFGDISVFGHFIIFLLSFYYLKDDILETFPKILGPPFNLSSIILIILAWDRPGIGWERACALTRFAIPLLFIIIASIKMIHHVWWLPWRRLRRWFKKRRRSEDISWMNNPLWKHHKYVIKFVLSKTMVNGMLSNSWSQSPLVLQVWSNLGIGWQISTLRLCEEFHNK